MHIQSVQNSGGGPRLHLQTHIPRTSSQTGVCSTVQPISQQYLEVIVGFTTIVHGSANIKFEKEIVLELTRGFDRFLDRSSNSDPSPKGQEK
jgi:hypothetical protein